MLNIHLGEFTDDCVTEVSEYFDAFKQEEWFVDSFVRKVIKEIDHTDVVEGEYLKSPVFGGMSPEHLSSGAKALILMRMDPAIKVYATRCGDNCSLFIKELSEMQDVNIFLHHCMRFPRYIHAFIVETGKEVFSDEEFSAEFYRYKHQVKGI